GLERYYNDQLVGRKEELGRLIDSIVTKDRVGDNLETTLDPKAQKVAMDAIQGRDGAVVALDVKTGAVRVLAGTPSFDPTDPGKRGSTIFNNATQRLYPPRSIFTNPTRGPYPPGTTFKTVTASAEIDPGRFQPDSRVSGKNGKVISGTPLN